MGNTNVELSKGLYSVVIIDLLDAYPYADVFDENRYAIVGRNYSSLALAQGLADRLFEALNPNADSLTKWEEIEGHDVRIYDGNMKCVYKAHQKLQAKNNS